MKSTPSHLFILHVNILVSKLHMSPRDQGGGIHAMKHNKTDIRTEGADTLGISGRQDPYMFITASLASRFSMVGVRASRSLWFGV